MELAKEIYVRHTKIVSAKKELVQRAIELGELLNQAKARVKHGEWLPWLKDNCHLPERTAERYMYVASNEPKLADALAAKSATMADLNSLNEAVRLISQSEPTRATPARAADDATTEDADDDQEEAAAVVAAGAALDRKVNDAESRFRNLLTELAETRRADAMVHAQRLVAWLIKAGLYKKLK